MSSRLPFFALLLSLLLTCSCTNKPKSSGYTVAIDPTWYPLQVAGQEKNILAFSVELLVKIAKKENLQFSMTRMSWDNLTFGLNNHQYDAILSTMRPYTFYLSKYSFSEPFLLSGPVIVVPKKSRFKSVEGKMVGVVTGSAAALLLQTTPKIILKGYDSIPEVLDALRDQQIEAASIDILIAQKYVRDLYSEKFKIVGMPLDNTGLRLITLYQKEPVLMKRFDKGLMALKKSGDYEKLLQKWGLSPDGKPIPNLNKQAEAFIQNIF